MSGDIAISSAQPRIAPIFAASTPALAITAPAQADAASVAASSKRPLLNPSLHLDLALNLVVLQFVDDKGDVTNSFPSAKQLKAYTAQKSDQAAAREANDKGSVLS